MVVNGTKSSWTDVLSGIPQGSVLGAILFVIYINDLPDTLKGHVKMFADDTKVFSHTRDVEDCTQYFSRIWIASVTGQRDGS